MGERSSPSSKRAGEVCLHRPATSLRRVTPVTPFVCAIVPGTTRSTHPPLPLPCRRCGQPDAGPTWSTLIRVRHFKHRLTPGTGHHSGRHTPCAVSLTLHYSSHVGRDFMSRPARHVRGSRPGIVSSALRALISGSRIQKRFPTHPGQVFPVSAPSLLRLTGKGLTPLSSLSFSRSAFSAEPRRGSLPGSSVSPPGGSRRQRALREPVEHFTRLALRLWSTPRRGIGSAPCSLRHPL